MHTIVSTIGRGQTSVESSCHTNIQAHEKKHRDLHIVLPTCNTRDAKIYQDTSLSNLVRLCLKLGMSKELGMYISSTELDSICNVLSSVSSLGNIQMVGSYMSCLHYSDDTTDVNICLKSFNCIYQTMQLLSINCISINNVPK